MLKRNITVSCSAGVYATLCRLNPVCLISLTQVTHRETSTHETDRQLMLPFQSRLPRHPDDAKPRGCGDKTWTPGPGGKLHFATNILYSQT